jgi:hypothetical protein
VRQLRADVVLVERTCKELDAVAEAMGLTRSQAIADAVELYLIMVRETRSGGKLTVLNADGNARVLKTASVAEFDWFNHREVLRLSEEETSAIVKEMQTDDPPGAALVDLLSYRRRR